MIEELVKRPTAGIRDSRLSGLTEREAQVLGALAGGSTVDSITAAIYPSLTETLVPMARESVLAHLQKLESERRVSRDGDRWVIA